MNKEIKKILTSIIFHNLRILHRITPQDTYIKNYEWHLDRCGDDFFDQYCLGFWWGTLFNPKKILEIGSRSGTSLIQLLSGCSDFKNKRICLFDLWNDGLCNPDLIKKHLTYLSIPVEPEFYIGDSRETIPKFKKNNTDKFDYILVDGGHSDEVALVDLENIIDLVSIGGVIVLDDISATIESDGFDLKPTWEKFKNKHLSEFEWFEDLAGKGTAWCVKK